MKNECTLSEVLEVMDEFRRDKSIETRCELSEKLLNYLKSPNSQPMVNYNDIHKLYEIVISSLDTLSYKLILINMEMVYPIVQRYCQSKSLQKLLTAVLNKLGDSKNQIREEAYKNVMLFIDTIPKEINFPQLALNNIKGSRNKHLKTHTIKLLTDYFNCMINEDNKDQFIPYIHYFTEFLSDANSEVRDEAAKTIMFLDNVMHDDVKKVILSLNNIPISKLRCLLPNLCDELSTSSKSSLNSFKSATLHRPSYKNNSSDTLYRISDKNNRLKSDKSYSSKTMQPRKHSASVSTKTGGIMGANSAPHSSLTEEDLMRLWEVDIFTNATSRKEICHELSEINEIISDIDQEWDIRIKKLRNLRGIFHKFSDELDKDDLMVLLKPLNQGLEISLKDLRSQVCKEACVTISYLSTKLGSHFGPLLELLLNTAILLFPNSIKIINSSAICCMTHCIKYTIEPRIINVLKNSIDNSKAKEIRKNCFVLLHTLLLAWPLDSYSNHTSSISHMILNGISDADSETRIIARQVFWCIAVEMKSLACHVYSKLDSQRQRTILREKPESFVGSLITTTTSEPVQLNRLTLNNNNFSRSFSNLALTSAMVSHKTNVCLSRISTNDEPFKLVSNQSLKRSNDEPFKFVSNQSLKRSNDEPFKRPSNEELPKPVIEFQDDDKKIESDKSTEFKIDKSVMNVQSKEQNCIDQERQNLLRQSSNIAFSTITNSKSRSRLGCLAEPSKLNSIAFPNTPRSHMLVSMRKQKSNLTAATLSSPLSNLNSSLEEIKLQVENFKNPAKKHLNKAGSTPFAFPARKVYSESSTHQPVSNIKSEITKGQSISEKIIVEGIIHNSPTSFETIVSNLDVNNSNKGKTQSKLKGVLGFISKMEPIVISHLMTIQNYIDDLFQTSLNPETLLLLLKVVNAFLMNYHNQLVNWIPFMLPTLLLTYDLTEEKRVADVLITAMETIRDTFNSQTQLFSIFSFVNNHRVVSLKAKLLVLHYISVLLIISYNDATSQQTWEDNSFVNTLSILTGWAMDLRDAELRKSAIKTIISISKIDPINFHKSVMKIHNNKQKFLSNISKSTLQSIILEEPSIDRQPFLVSKSTQDLLFDFKDQEDYTRNSQF